MNRQSNKKSVLLSTVAFCAFLALTPGPAQQPSGSSVASSAAQPELWAGASQAEAISTAWTLFNAGKLNDAEAAFQQIVRTASENKDSLSEAEARLGLGEVAFRHARFSVVRKEYEEAKTLFDSLHNTLGVARANVGLGDAANWFVDPKTARDLYGQALNEFTTRGMEREKCQVLMKLAPVTDSYPDRIKLDTQALEIARKLGDQRLQGEAFQWMGQWVFHEGDSEAAERDYRQAETLLDTPEGRVGLGRVFLSEGRLQRAHGAMEQSIETFGRGLKITEETDNQETRIQLLNAMAASYGDLKKYRDALGMFQQAFELAKNTGSPRMIETLRQNIAEAYIDLGEERRGAEMLEEVARQNPDPYPYQAQFRYATLALAYWHLHEYDRALAAAARSVQEAQARKNEQFLPEPLMLKAHAEEKLGQNDAALADGQDAIKVIEGLRARLVPSDFLKRGFSEKTQEAFDFCVGLLQSTNQPAQAIEVAEEARSRAFLDLLATHQLALRQGAEQTLIAADKGSSQPIAAPQPPHNDSSAVDQLVQRGGKVNPPAHATSSAEPELPSGASAGSASLKEMQEQAARLHSTILSYWVSDEATFVWIVASGKEIHGVRIPVKRDHLVELVSGVWPSKGDAPAEDKSARSEARLSRGGEVEFPARGEAKLKANSNQKDRWRELYRLLIQPIEPYLPAVEGARITVIPHGPLFALPFAGLRDARGRYFLERYTLEYSPAISVLRFTGARPASSNSATAQFLLIGDPTGMDKIGLPQLPGSRKEVSEIARRLPPQEVQLLLGKDAQLETVRLSAAKSTVIHFATHGILDDKQPFDSFLALSDGKLTTRDIYGLDLNSDLVFLSACRSGMGKVTGDGVLGLTRAFLYAGTRSVVATLWDVADEPTARLVASFYKNIGQGQGEDKAQALRGAQLSVLRQLRAGRMKIATPGGPLTLPENPVFWASFVLIGEP